jgi:hypothetical protein
VHDVRGAVHDIRGAVRDVRGAVHDHWEGVHDSWEGVHDSWEGVHDQGRACVTGCTRESRGSAAYRLTGAHSHGAAGLKTPVTCQV